MSLNIFESGFMSKRSIAQNLKRTFQDSPVWRFEYSPSKLSADVEVHPTERVGNIGLARYTRNMCGVILWRLCQAQWEPSRLFIGWCLPVPLMIAIFAASLSQSWAYCDVRSGCKRTGAMMAAHASRK